MEEIRDKKGKFTPGILDKNPSVKNLNFEKKSWLSLRKDGKDYESGST